MPFWVIKLKVLAGHGQITDALFPRTEHGRWGWFIGHGDGDSDGDGDGVFLDFRVS